MRSVFVCAYLFLSVSAVSAQYQSEIGYTDLQSLLGAGTPNGSSISVSHVEALSSGNYRPNTAAIVFSGKNFTLKSGASGISSHATGVGALFYGNTGIAPAINTIDVYEASHWIGAGMLNALSPDLPEIETNDVANFSWIGNANTTSQATDMLRRLDLSIERDEYVAVVAVNNGQNTLMPHLLANSYNAISVGLTNGNSSHGLSTVDVVGRSVPHLVVRDSFTSNATAIVSASAALLLDQANKDSNANAQNSESVKAMLIAGATKDEFDLNNSTVSTLDDWSHTTTQPLDDRLGAGELNIYNAYQIYAAGEQEAGNNSLVSLTGWDFGSIGVGGQNLYFFDVLANQTVDELSIALTWNRHITATPDGSNPLILASLMPNLDIKLYNADGFTLQSLVDESISTIDNLEHVYQLGLTQGRYAIAINRSFIGDGSDASAWDYALAWRSQVTTVPEASSLLLVGVGLTLVGARRLRNHQRITRA
ncbi:MAG: hypothetical protein U1D30_00565 [Planctomycetota bacterium]